MQAPHNRGHIWYLSHACGALDRGCVVQALSHPSVMAEMGQALVAKLVTRNGETEKDCLQISMLPQSVLAEMNSRQVPEAAYHAFIDYTSGIDFDRSCYALGTSLSMVSRKGTHFGRLVNVPSKVFSEPGKPSTYSDKTRALALTDPWYNGRGEVVLVVQVERGASAKGTDLPEVLRDVPLDARLYAKTNTLRIADAEKVVDIEAVDYTAQARQMQESFVALASGISPMVKPSRFGDPFLGRDD